jgi:DNA-binding NarL/FixJ family response regulator
VAGQKPAIEFSDREEQVLDLLARGLSNKAIAFRLDLSDKTVKYYLTHIMRKLQVRNRVEAAIYASQRANVQPPIQAVGRPARRPAGPSRAYYYC